MSRDKKILSNHQKKMSKYYSQERVLDYNFDEINLGELENKEQKIETKTYKFMGYCSNRNCLNMIASCDIINQEDLIFKCFKCGLELEENKILKSDEYKKIKQEIEEEENDDEWCWTKLEEEEDEDDISLSLEKKSEVKVGKNSEVEIEEEEEEDEEIIEEDEEEKINYYIENFLNIEEE